MKSRKSVIVASLIALVVVISTLWGASVEHLGPWAQKPSSSGDQGPQNGFPFPRNGLTYNSEHVSLSIEKGSVNISRESNYSFLGVTFRLWLELPPEGFVLRGFGIEPDGVGLGFLLFPNASSAGHPGDIGAANASVNESVETYFSPDGVFGAEWLAWNGTTLQLELAVSSPGPAYVATNASVQTPVGPNNSSRPVTVIFAGVTFDLVLQGWDLTVAPWLNISAKLPSGTTVWITIPGGPPRVVCGIDGPPPPKFYFQGESACEETASPGLAVAAAGWEGGTQASLLVRVA